MKIMRYLLSMTLCSFALNVNAEGTIITIEGATIRGNQELPTVLYLVPWQPPQVHSLEKPKQTLASSRPIKLLDRESFLRMQSYHQAFLKAQSDESKAQ